MTVPWTEGNAEDFADLHEAIESGRAKKFSADDQPDPPAKFSDSEDDEEEEVEVEPSPDDHGLFLYNILPVN